MLATSSDLWHSDVERCQRVADPRGRINSHVDGLGVFRWAGDSLLTFSDSEINATKIRCSSPAMGAGPSRGVASPCCGCVWCPCHHPPAVPRTLVLIGLPGWVAGDDGVMFRTVSGMVGLAMIVRLFLPDEVSAVPGAIYFAVAGLLGRSVSRTQHVGLWAWVVDDTARPHVWILPIVLAVLGCLAILVHRPRPSMFLRP